jgi:hypothetical protein
MSDFFDDKQADTAEENKQELENIKIGETEYTPEEAQHLIELGKLGKEAEEKFNTKLDKVWPEFSRSQNELKSTKEELEKYKQQLQDQAKQNAVDPNLTEEQRRTAREQAKAIGIVTNDQLEEWFESKFSQKYSSTREAERLLEDTSKLEKEINGSDGRPKFNQQEVLEYMRDNGIRNPQVAYKLKYEDQLDKWKEDQLNKNKNRGIYTQITTSGNKQPKEIRPNKSNIEALMAEALGEE